MPSQVVDLTGKPIVEPLFKDISGEAKDACEFANDLYHFILHRSPSQMSLFEVVGVIEMVKHDVIEVSHNVE